MTHSFRYFLCLPMWIGRVFFVLGWLFLTLSLLSTLVSCELSDLNDPKDFTHLTDFCELLLFRNVLLHILHFLNELSLYRLPLVYFWFATANLGFRQKDSSSILAILMFFTVRIDLLRSEGWSIFLALVWSIEIDFSNWGWLGLRHDEDLGLSGWVGGR